MSGTPVDTQRRMMASTLATYPLNRFARDFVTGDGNARRLLPAPHLDTLSPPGSQRGSDALAAALIASNALWGNDVSVTVRNWRSGNSVAIVAGQQVGYAGGPLYTIAKVATLLKLRAMLCSQGKEVTLFFWLATEDHDYDEVANVYFGTKEGLQRVKPDERPAKSTPVGDLAIPESLRRRVIEALPPGDQGAWLKAGLTFRDSFARLMATVFAGDELVLLDSLLPELRRAGEPLLHRIVDAHDEIEQLLHARAAEITEYGYQPQVVPDAEGRHSLLFLIDNGERLHLRRDGDGFSAGGRMYTLDQLHELITNEPEKLSTGALTRPLLQDAVLQPDLFVGGPAELAYYAQLKPVADATKVRQAAVALRGHALVVPRRALEALDRYGIDAAHIFDDPESLVLAHEPKALAALESELGSMLDEVETRLERIDAIVAIADRGMQKSIDRSRSHLRYHLERLGERSRRAIARRDRERYDAVVAALHLVAPDRIPQDRKVAWISYWMKYGRTLIDRLVEEVEPQADVWKIVGL